MLIAEKLDYLQSKLLQNFFFLFANPLGRVGVWLNEVIGKTYDFVSFITIYWAVIHRVQKTYDSISFVTRGKAFTILYVRGLPKMIYLMA